LDESEICDDNPEGWVDTLRLDSFLSNSFFVTATLNAEAIVIAASNEGYKSKGAGKVHASSFSEISLLRRPAGRAITSTINEDEL